MIKIFKNIPSLKQSIIQATNESALYNRKITSSNEIIYDYIENNINELFFGAQNDKFNYNIDKENNILNIDLYRISRGLDINNEMLSKFSGSIQKIVLNFFNNNNIFFTGRRVNIGKLKDINIDLNYKVSISGSQISIFYDGFDKIENCNINITPDKISNQNNNKFQYHFDNEKFNLFKDTKGLENFLDSILFKNNIINSKGSFLIFELDDSDKKYKDLENMVESIGYDNYIDYLNKNILKNKYKVESIKFFASKLIIKLF